MAATTPTAFGVEKRKEIAVGCDMFFIVTSRLSGPMSRCTGTSNCGSSCAPTGTRWGSASSRKKSIDETGNRRGKFICICRHIAMSAQNPTERIMAFPKEVPA